MQPPEQPIQKHANEDPDTSSMEATGGSEAVQDARKQSSNSNTERNLPGSSEEPPEDSFWENDIDWLYGTREAARTADHEKENKEMIEFGTRKLPRDDDGPDPDKNTTDEDSDFEEG